MKCGRNTKERQRKRDIKKLDSMCDRRKTLEMDLQKDKFNRRLGWGASGGEGGWLAERKSL